MAKAKKSKYNLIPEIVRKLKEEGRAQFDFGTFHVFERGHATVKLLTTGKVKKVKPYLAIFFTASTTLKRKVKRLRGRI